MNYEQLKNSILQEAIEGRLVKQDPNDEPAAVLLDRIADEKNRLIKEKKIKRDKNESRIYRTDDGHWMERFSDKNRPEMCIDDGIPFDIPESWEWCRLSEICSLLSRGKSPKYLDTDKRYPVFAQKCNLKEGGISLSQARFLDPSSLSKWPEEYHLRTGDVLVNSTGTGTVGRTRLFDEKYLGEYPFVVPDSHVSVVRTFDDISSKYIYSVLSTKLVQDYFEDNLKGATNQKELYIAVLIDLLIPLPPKEEQFRIAAKIEEVLPKIEEYGKAQDRLDALNAALPEKLKASILQEAIEGRLVEQNPDDEPASKLLDCIAEEKAKLVKEKKIKADKNASRVYRSDDGHWMEHFADKHRTDVCIDDEIPFDIPDSWEWCRHNSLFNISGGSQPPKSNFSDVKKDGYIRLYQIRDYGKSPVPVYVPKEKVSKFTHEGDILLARYGGSLGKVFWAKEGAYNVAMAKVIPLYTSKLIDIRYIYYYYHCGLYQNLVKAGNRSAQGGFNKDDLNALFFPLPPLEEQHRIVQKIESILKKIDSL